MTLFHETEPFQTLKPDAAGSSCCGRPDLGYMQKGLDETKMKLHAFSPGEISLRIDARKCFKIHRIRGIQALAPVATAAGDISIGCRMLPFFLIKDAVSSEI